MRVDCPDNARGNVRDNAPDHALAHALSTLIGQGSPLKTSDSDTQRPTKSPKPDNPAPSADSAAGQSGEAVNRDGENHDPAPTQNDRPADLDDREDETNDPGAYLVLQAAGRWSDIFRLMPPGEAIIGRASASQIAIRTDQASRRHARIYWDGHHWVIEDLNSRNGTYVNNSRLSQVTPLNDGDTINVAGYAISFTKRIQTASGAAPDASPQATDDQMTTEMDPGAITDRRRHSRYLQREGSHDAERSNVSGQLLQLAFELARIEKASAAVDAVIAHLKNQIHFDTAGVYAGESGNTLDGLLAMPLAATAQSGNRSYRRPPESLLKSVASEGGQAILARNVLGDTTIATENSRGEIDVESIIITPVRNRDGRLLGMIHMTTTGESPAFEPDDLEVAVAVAEILAESLSSLSDRKRLAKSLRRTRKQVEQLQNQIGDKVKIVGRSKAITQVVEQIGLAAPTNVTVLVRGESGVGKELVASALHHASSRKDGPLICLNCAALSPTLLESELFGHEKGSFTGATERKQGKFEAADGGTLMLDEIGEMNQEIQAKFLRVLEGHPFERVGGQAAIKVDVRVIAATNRDLQAMVADGSFRQDLYYRLNVVEILVPPLRERGDDCLMLAEFFLDRFNREMGRRIEGLTDAARAKLVKYSWPGNIRELKNVIERAVVLNTKTMIDESDLALVPASVGGVQSSQSSDPVEITIAELEQMHIERVLRHTGGNKSRAASILGIERSTLDRKLKKFASE